MVRGLRQAEPLDGPPRPAPVRRALARALAAWLRLWRAWLQLLATLARGLSNLGRGLSNLGAWMATGLRVGGIVRSARNPNRVFVTSGPEGESLAPDLGGDLPLDRETRDFIALARSLADLNNAEMERISDLLRQLAETWVQDDELTVPRDRHTQLDLRRTLRVNLPRYGGHVFNFYWEMRPRQEKVGVQPAKLLVIGDVSNSMTRYAGALLFFFHSLGHHFEVDSWVFSEQPTHASPWLRAGLTFAKKVENLAAHARSWNGLTVLGSSLQEILKEAKVDKDTYVIIATDGQVRILGGEYPKIVKAMDSLRQRAREVHILTPVPEFAEKGQEYARAFEALTAVPLGAAYTNPPPWELKVTWYGTLAAHADRVRLVRSAADLVEYCRDVLREANPRTGGAVRRN
ncbi:MAG: VWA domain-containing protein [Symbiobacteriia bacterium]